MSTAVTGSVYLEQPDIQRRDGAYHGVGFGSSARRRTSPYADGRLEQILVNLLGNAVRHTPERSTVHVRAVNRDDRVVLHVEDAGPGIAASDAEQIFDVYVTNAGEEMRGHGLGLPLSRRLARLLGGELRVVPGQGTGACFELELPASTE